MFMTLKSCYFQTGIEIEKFFLTIENTFSSSGDQNKNSQISKVHFGESFEMMIYLTPP